jgi:D-alanine-D-alanine ligase
LNKQVVENKEFFDLKNLKIAVIYGGISSEREISIKSGKAVEKALKKLGIEHKQFDPINKDSFLNGLVNYNPDIAFLALHGKGGEDGIIQGLLEFLGIPYTGSGVKASAVAMDKSLTKTILKSNKIPVPEGFILQDMNDLKNLDNFDFPVVVKANSEGSSVGVFIVNNINEMKERVKDCFKLDNKVIVEQFINGRELTVSILNGKPLDIVEIKVEDGFYDYKNKYITGKTEYICPAEIDKKSYEKLQDIALKAYNLIECKGAARVDIILDKDFNPYVLEINTIPGLTEHSLLPKAAKSAGLSFEELILEMVRGVINEKKKK